MERHEPLKSNIPKLYWAHFFTGLVFWYGIEKLFLLNIGAGGSGISINAIVLAVIMLIFDVPSGVLADTWGRKRTLILAMVAIIGASFIYSISESLNVYLIGTIMYGFYMVCTSGTYQAIIYDSLHEIGEAQNFNKVNGRIYAAFMAGIGIALLISGLLAQKFGFQFNFRLSIISSFIALGIILTIREPAYHKVDYKNRLLSRYIREGIITLRKSPALIGTAVLFLMLGVFRWMSDEFSQLVLSSFRVNIALISVIGAGAFLAGIIGRLLAHRFHHRAIISVFINLVLFALVGFAPLPIVVVSLIVFYGLNNLLQNNNDTIIQENLPSHIRATATSMFSLMNSLLIIIFGIGAAILLKTYSIFLLFKIITIIGLLATVCWLILLRKEKAKQEI